MFAQTRLHSLWKAWTKLGTGLNFGMTCSAFYKDGGHPLRNKLGFLQQTWFLFPDVYTIVLLNTFKTELSPMTKKVSFNLHHNYVLLISMQFITTLKRVSHKSCHVCGLKKNATLCRLRYSFAPSTAIKHWVTKLSLFIFLVLNAVQCISSSSNKKKFIPI